jgi:hypothetical protein
MTSWEAMDVVEKDEEERWRLGLVRLVDGRMEAADGVRSAGDVVEEKRLYCCDGVASDTLLPARVCLAVRVVELEE